MWLCSGYLIEAREEEDVQRRSGDKHSRKIYTRCKSAGVVFAEWRVIGVGGKFLSPNASAGVEGSKFKSTVHLVSVINMHFVQPVLPQQHSSRSYTLSPTCSIQIHTSSSFIIALGFYSRGNSLLFRRLYMP